MATNKEKNITPLPSISAQSSFILQALENGRLGHALIAKLYPHDRLTPAHAPEFFSALQILLCSQLAESAGHSLSQACRHCPSCQLFQNWCEDTSFSVHPDLLVLHPENTQGYSVEQIRDMNRFLALKSHLSPRRIVLIYKAEQLRAAHGAPANALLKVLEEPRPSHHIFLLTSHADVLLPTLKSRCQSFILKLQGLSEEPEEDWSQLQDWVKKSCPPLTSNIQTPADLEAFWKDRQYSLNELTKAFNRLWKEAQMSFQGWGREESLRVLDFFTGFENILRSTRGYGNGLIHWYNWKNQSLRGSIWKP